jgi:hypothetical protein
MQNISPFLEAFVNIVFIVSGIGLAIIPLIWDIKKDAPIDLMQNARVSPDRKMFTRMGRVFILLSALAIASGTVKFVIDNATVTSMQKGIMAQSVAHANDSMNQIIKDAACKNEAELSEARYSLALAEANKNINEKIDGTARTTQNKVDSIHIKDAIVSITPGLALVEVDTVENQLHANFILCNDGNVPVSNVRVEVWEVNKQNTNDSKCVARFKTDFAAAGTKENCSVGHYFHPFNHNIRNYYFVYRIRYRNRKGKEEDEIRAIMYSYPLKAWAINGSDFKWLFK